MVEAFERIIAGDAPVFVLVAGPNGAGKSTFRKRLLDPVGVPCIDPDEVGLQMHGSHAQTKEQAREATLEATSRVRQHVGMGRSVALETVFSDENGYKLQLLDEAKAAGFNTVVIFIGVDDPQISIARVMERAMYEGGHDVPDELIEARFPRTFENLKKALPIADLTILIDNSGCYGEAAAHAHGLRHYQFAVLERGTVVELKEPQPAWYHNFGIAKVSTTQKES